MLNSYLTILNLKYISSQYPVGREVCDFIPQERLVVVDMI